uniref:hypothetical protein n=1 Tax=Piscirickettsia salmonis TaxID=1238 RepID=UPI0039F6B4A5
MPSNKIDKLEDNNPIYFRFLQSEFTADINSGLRSKSEIHRVDATAPLSERAPNFKIQKKIAPLTPFFKHLLQSEISSRGGLDYKSEVNDDIAKEISSFCM